ncbi:hypothetical protein FHX80_112858 [Streptomyces brevispora]|uniref:Uncharacterized protein n=1 Tax=Streptomyces brevispora TaxID=887462 RepID=A0A561UYH4_9ACTN|nr:hypothetical protein [Streptomyces brevispora]TWG04411.1 hypothetical protein FHX80_112858 [Streptomyces brevispora]
MIVVEGIGVIGEVVRGLADAAAYTDVAHCQPSLLPQLVAPRLAAALGRNAFCARTLCS